MEIIIERLMQEERKHKDHEVLSESESNGALAANHRTGLKVLSAMGVKDLDIFRGTALNVHDSQQSLIHLSIRSHLVKEGRE